MPRLGIGISLARSRSSSAPSATIAITDLGARYVLVPGDLECTVTGAVDHVVWSYDVGAGEVEIESVAAAPWTTHDWTPPSAVATTVWARSYNASDVQIAEASAVVTVGALTLELCIQDGTIVWLYDAEYGVVASGGYVTSWTPKVCVGGGAADVLIPTAGQDPVSNATDAEFGGRPSVERTTQGFLRSTTPASAVTVAQPHTVIDICKTPPATPTGDAYLYDSASTGYRGAVWRSSNTWSASAGTAWNTGLAMSAATPLMSLARHESTSSTLKTRTNAGVAASAGPGNAGTNSMRGLALFGAYSSIGLAIGKRTAIMCVAGTLSAADEARLLWWHQNVLGWS